MKIMKVVKWSRLMLLVLCLFMFGMVAFGGENNAEASPANAIAEAVQNPSATTDTGVKYMCIAAIMACGSFAAALAVGKVGTAAMGAASERPELLGKAIAFVGLGEGIALFGFLISLMMLNK